MHCIPSRLPYRQTNQFSKIVLDYVDQLPALKPFFEHQVSVSGIRNAIEERKQFKTNRALLVAELEKQYAGIEKSEKTLNNIHALMSEDTFTITTAHQNNIFTGPLYFIYKILHAIKLADHLNTIIPEHKFVPLFYIGSEDADLEELNHISVDGKKMVWETSQSGAVGRMNIDKKMTALIDEMHGQLAVLPHGDEIISLLRKCYREGETIQNATFYFVNYLFKEYGLIVLLPDNTSLKREMKKIFEDDLVNRGAAAIVEKSTEKITEAGYKVQAHPRDINLFYLKDDLRERIVENDGVYSVLNTDLKYSRDGILELLDTHPEYFSPNVILRGLYQETILPNIAFIGGGGETAYWLQLKDLFEYYKTPFPVLVLRNSFLMVTSKEAAKIAKLGLGIDEIFSSEHELMNRIVKREREHDLNLQNQLESISALYEQLQNKASAIDKTLDKHVSALKEKAIHKIVELEKKMLRSEKRKFQAHQNQIQSIRNHLFPGDGLQERKENLSYFYALWGCDFIKALYNHSLALEQEFVVLCEV